MNKIKKIKIIGEDFTKDDLKSAYTKIFFRCLLLTSIIYLSIDYSYFKYAKDSEKQVNITTENKKAIMDEYIKDFIVSKEINI